MFYTRSVESVIHYLGEVVRRALNPEPLAHLPIPPRHIQVKHGPPYIEFPDHLRCNGYWIASGTFLDETPAEIRAAGHACKNLFVLDAGLVGTGIPGLSVNYGGVRYSVPSNPQRAGMTLKVLSILRQLVAVNTSAKALPATTVISVSP